MDGREAMSSYYLNRGIGSPSGLTALPAFRQMPSPNPSMAVHSSGLGSGSIVSAFQVESSSSAAPHGGVNVGGRLAGVGSGEPVKKRRGRPRKYGPEGTMSLALSPLSSTSPPGLAPAPGAGTAAGSGSEMVSATPTPKRGRGRPPGTGRKQQLASLGEWVSGSAGTGFTPHVITIPVGEDITAKIMSFSQQGPRTVCILSANGAVSSVTLRQPASSGGTVTYEGRFELLCLSGSYFLTDDSGGRSRSGGLSASLSSPDGRVIGGEVGGTLIAASPVQVIVGSFIYGGSKQKNKAKTGQDLAAESEPPTGDNPSTPSSTLPNQSLSPLVMGGWPVSRQMDVRNPTIGIDLMQG